MMFLRTFDFYFFSREDLVQFLLALSHLNPDLNEEIDLCRPSLLRLKLFKIKLAKIGKSMKLEIHSLFIYLLYL